MTKILYAENPLRSKVVVDETTKLLLAKSIEVEELYTAVYDLCNGRLEDKSFTEIAEDVEKEVERQMSYLLPSLESGEWHSGDCTDCCFSCSKCYAEDMLGIYTLQGFSKPYYVDLAFSNGRDKIDDAIQYLKDNPAEVSWEGSEKYVKTWQKHIDNTIEELERYKALRLLND